MIGRVLRRAAHCELVEVCLAEDDGVRIMQFRHDCRVIGRDEILKDFRPCRRPHTLCANIVLHSAGDARKKGNLFPCRDLCIHAICLAKRYRTHLQKIRANLAFDGVHARAYILGQFMCTDLLAHEHVMQNMRRFFI